MNVTVLGLGLFAGGVATARFFAESGHKVTVSDLRDASTLKVSIDALDDLEIRYVLGSHRDVDIIDADLIVVGPGVKEDSPFLRLARDSGVSVTTEINLVFELCRAPIIGVTGSNGKTTTTSLLEIILRDFDQRSVVGGNIGKSVLNGINHVPENTLVALELSSFQLQRLRWIGRSPHVSVVTNLAPNHLDWHGSFEKYSEAKFQILRDQQPEDFAVLNADDPVVASWAARSNGKVVWYGTESPTRSGAFVREETISYRMHGLEQKICQVSDIQIPGPHNVANTMAAISAAMIVGVPVSTIKSAIKRFRGVPHRLEAVRTLDGVRYYNDSACTTPESCETALGAFEVPIVLIAGGYDKGAGFAGLAQEIVRSAKAVVLIGDTAEAIEEAIGKQQSDPMPSILLADSMEDAVSQSRNMAKNGDVILLSPACASYDMFDNFESRGEVFKSLVAALN
ncbi:MAG: UDP-N-acetylmuramoyl-L-alanine--D-glutamate ligase [Bacteroidetes Order II. Incertae sedis bacterium]|nr:UDP-N-acetylmuramoyl-L-alanine--D-glutamate ligase [Bacteroidetes Order II. bacterium]